MKKTSKTQRGLTPSRSDPSRWLRGSMVALITPFRKPEGSGEASSSRSQNGEVDVTTLQKLVEFHVKSGTSAIVPCGTTGESATLSHEEHEQVIEMVIQTARGRVAVIAGTGSNNTQEALRFTRHAQRAGADGALLISPYYNKPTQEGLVQHFRAVAEAVEIPIVIYNIASRTGVNIEPETFERLAKIRNIAGVKESSGNLEQMSRIKALCGEKFALISGDDGLTLPVLAIGGTGVISVVANILPKEVAQMVAAFHKGRLEEARKIHYHLLAITKAVFIETNPIPVKTAMGLMKLIPEAGLRLPMCALSPANLARLKEVLRSYKLI